MSEPYGPTSREPFAYYDHDTLCWKMLQLSLDLNFSGPPTIWPRAGMTSRGLAYELPTSVPHTAANGSSSLPTPTAADGERASLNYCRGNPTLIGALLPSAVMDL
jgi:hypothetical protein